MKCFLFCANLVSSSVPQLESEPEVIQISKAPKDVPFAIPEKWKWVNLHSTLKAISDGSHNPPPNVGHGVPVLSAKNVINGIIDTNSVTRWTTEEQWSIEDKKIHIQSGDVLLTIVGTIGRTAVVPNDCEKFMLQRSVCVMKPKECVNPEFLALILNSPSLFEWIMDHASGTAQKGIYLKTVKQIPSPLPSIEEQHRIVEKIKKLFEQIDSAEKAYNELSGPLSERFRQLCLEKAIQGKLVPQLESEPEVEQIGNAPEEVPFEIPKKWKWVQLSSAGKIVGGGTPKTGITAYWGGKISWITPADLGRTGGRYISFGAKSITQTGLDNSSAKLLPPGSVVYSSRAPIGHIAIAGKELCTNQGCKSFIPNFKTITTEWGYFCLIARTPDIISRASGTTFKEISGSGVGETWIPLPPLAEQRRIVDKLKTCLKQIEKLQQE